MTCTVVFATQGPLTAAFGDAEPVITRKGCDADGLEASVTIDPAGTVPFLTCPEAVGVTMLVFVDGPDDDCSRSEATTKSLAVKGSSAWLCDVAPCTNRV